MKLSASRLAQWFVQGELHSAASEQASLVFNSNNVTETIPFAIWDGKCHIERGLLWGKLSFILTPLDEPIHKLTVFGLPWRQLPRFANELAVQYQTWLTSQRELLIASEETLFAIQKELDDHAGYLRHSDLIAWQEKATALLQSLDIHPQVLTLLNPALFENFYGWLMDAQKRRSERNQWWLEKELKQWQSWFKKIESSALNLPQQKAVLMGENHNLVLAGAGAGKTSVIVARCRYLVASGQAKPNNILILAFGKKASTELTRRLTAVGLGEVDVATFHSLARKAITDIINEQCIVSAIASDETVKQRWMSQWLVETFSNPISLKRWQKHLKKWPMLGVNTDEELSTQTENKALHKWLWRHVDLLLLQSLPLTGLKQFVRDDEQALSELTLMMPLLHHYQGYLSSRGEFDFHGLIDRATDLLSRKTSDFAAQYDHIMVDEYQDISPARQAFLQALCQVKRARAPSFFAVGDDWQAIYRFAGADVNLTTGFASRFPASETHYLDTTYRFNSKIGEVANHFIQANPAQLIKTLNSNKVQKRKAVHLINEYGIEGVLAKLAKIAGDNTISLLLIGRNKHNQPDALNAWQANYPNINMQYVTAHASKGLEADYSIIFAVDEGVFPAPALEAGLEYILLTNFNEIEYAEERRLFYVALTRAKHACWICCDPEKPSVFVQELAEGYAVTNALKVKKKQQSILLPAAIEPQN